MKLKNALTSNIACSRIVTFGFPRNFCFSNAKSVKHRSCYLRFISLKKKNRLIIVGRIKPINDTKTNREISVNIRRKVLLVSRVSRSRRSSHICPSDHLIM